MKKINKRIGAFCYSVQLTTHPETRAKLSRIVLTVYSKNILQVAQIKKVLVRLVAGEGFEPSTFRL